MPCLPCHAMSCGNRNPNDFAGEKHFCHFCHVFSKSSRNLKIKENFFKSDGKRGKYGKTIHEVLREIKISALLDPLIKCKTMSKKTLQMNQFFTLGGKVLCNQCQAQSKHSRSQCKKPAIKGKRVCLTHGGRSSGPRTEQGRQRCADAKTIHGNETRKARNERAEAMRRLRILEHLGHALGLLIGARMPGSKP